MFIKSNSVVNNKQLKKTNTRQINNINSPTYDLIYYLNKVVNNDTIIQLMYQILCLLILGVVYKNNIYILTTIKKLHTDNTNTLSYYLIYYKTFIISFILVTFSVNYVMFTKSVYNITSMKQLLMFLILQIFLAIIIFNNIDKHILNLDTFINSNNNNNNNSNNANNDNNNNNNNSNNNNNNSNNNTNANNNKNNNSNNNTNANNNKNNNSNNNTNANNNKNNNSNNNTNANNNNSNNNNTIVELPQYSESLKYQTDYNHTELPEYVKSHPNQDAIINKPEHYDYTPDNIPQWHLDPELSKKFEELKKQWYSDPNNKFRVTVKAFDKYSIPPMDDGFKFTHPEKYTKLFNLFEMNRENNKPNKIIIQALESGGYDGKYIHNTEHLRRHSNTNLSKLQRYNKTGEYYDPDNVFQSLKDFPNPTFDSLNLCQKEKAPSKPLTLNDINKNMIRADLQDTSNVYHPNTIYKTSKESESKSKTKSTTPPNLANLSNLDTIPNTAGMEYLYESDEINTQVLNTQSGFKHNNTKSKNIIQYCTNYKPANKEQLRMVNDNTAYTIYENK